MAQDEELKTERLDFLGLKDEEGARHLMTLGHAWAARNALRIDAHFAAVPRSATAPQGAPSRRSRAPGWGHSSTALSWPCRIRSVCGRCL